VATGAAPGTTISLIRPRGCFIPFRTFYFVSLIGVDRAKRTLLRVSLFISFHSFPFLLLFFVTVFLLLFFVIVFIFLLTVQSVHPLHYAMRSIFNAGLASDCGAILFSYLVHL